MANAVGYDAIHDDIASIPFDPEMVLGYDTGTPDIRWTLSDWGLFPGARHVHIDQSGPGSPVPTSTVRDVETGAWDPVEAVIQTANWTAGRRTIYCNQSTLPRVLAAGWKGDLWLAIPSDVAPSQPPVVPGCTVVAVQWQFSGAFDQSVVFDPYWPTRAPGKPGIQYPQPANLRETVTANIAWDLVAPVNGRAPADYTVLMLDMSGREFYRSITPSRNIAVQGLTHGWTYEVRVWANGGDIAPPHATLIIHV